MRLFFLSVATLSFEGFEVKGAREMADFGEMVLLHCVCTLDDGTVAIDTKAAGEPLRVRIGSSVLPSAEEMAAANLLPGGTAQVSLDPDQAFGVYDESLVFRVPRNALPHADELSVGGRILVETPAGTADVEVVAVDSESIVVDCNHRFAGRSARYDIELVALVHDSAIQRELHPAGCACGCDKLKAQIG